MCTRTYQVWGITDGTYFRRIVKTYARNVPRDRLDQTVADAQAAGWADVRYEVEAF